MQPDVDRPYDVVQTHLLESALATEHILCYLVEWKLYVGRPTNAD